MSKKKHKQPEILQRPEDCKTIEQKLAYSSMMRERWESIEYDEPPSAILDFDRFPMPDPSMPWTHPEWAAHYTRARKKRNNGFLSARENGSLIACCTANQHDRTKAVAVAPTTRSRWIAAGRGRCSSRILAAPART
jgi:hypothetical protein